MNAYEKYMQEVNSAEEIPNVVKLGLHCRECHGLLSIRRRAVSGLRDGSFGVGCERCESYSCTCFVYRGEGRLLREGYTLLCDVGEPLHFTEVTDRVHYKYGTYWVPGWWGCTGGPGDGVKRALAALPEVYVPGLDVWKELMRVYREQIID